MIRELGRVPYETALALQRELAGRRADGAIDDTLLLCEHDDVITVGRGARAGDLASVPFPIVEVERGGEATWHGPGQLVGYPILALIDGERDLHLHLRRLEDAMLGALRALGFEGRRNPPHTGAWIGDRKVASIGVAVKRWVTLHGFALNVDTPAAAFRSFRPCGLDPGVMDSLARIGGRPLDAARVSAAVVASFLAVFDRVAVPSPR